MTQKNDSLNANYRMMKALLAGLLSPYPIVQNFFSNYTDINVYQVFFVCFTPVNMN